MSFLPERLYTQLVTLALYRRPLSTTSTYVLYLRSGFPHLFKRVFAESPSFTTEPPQRKLSALQFNDRKIKKIKDWYLFINDEDLSEANQSGTGRFAAYTWLSFEEYLDLRARITTDCAAAKNYSSISLSEDKR